MLKSVLLLGGSGLLGREWSARLLARDIGVVSSIHSCSSVEDGVTSVKLDFGREEDIRHLLGSKKFDVVINLIAITNVERCAALPDEALATNALIARRVAIVCEDLGLKFVQMSTDQLFDGISPFRKETDSVSPVNEYATTKALAESLILRTNPAALIIRTNFFCRGPSYRLSFYDQIVQSLQSDRPMGLFDDIYFTPIFVYDLMEAVETLVISGKSGIYHIVGSERVSKYEFGLIVAASKKMPPSCLVRARFVDRNDLVIRPLDMSLCNAKITAELGPITESLSDGLNQLVETDIKFNS